MADQTVVTVDAEDVVFVESETAVDTGTTFEKDPIDVSTYDNPDDVGDPTVVQAFTGLSVSLENVVVEKYYNWVIQAHLRCKGDVRVSGVAMNSTGELLEETVYPEFQVHIRSSLSGIHSSYYMTVRVAVTVQVSPGEGLFVSGPSTLVVGAVDTLHAYVSPSDVDGEVEWSVDGGSVGIGSDVREGGGVHSVTVSGVSVGRSNVTAKLKRRPRSRAI